jgi:hypothetical protein
MPYYNPLFLNALNRGVAGSSPALATKEKWLRVGGAIFVHYRWRIEKPFWRGAPDAQSVALRCNVVAAHLGSRVPPSRPKRHGAVYLHLVRSRS